MGHRERFKAISLGGLGEGPKKPQEGEMIEFFGWLALALIAALVLLVWADTAQVLYMAKRLGHYCQRHRVLLVSHHYFLAAVAISSKSLALPLVMLCVAFNTGWLATWMADALLVSMLLYRTRSIEKNQERIDKLQADKCLDFTYGSQ